MKRYFMAVLLAWLGLAAQASAATIYVSTNGSHDFENNFDSWPGAATNINEAVALANALVRNVMVSNGIYAVTNTLVVTNAFSVSSVNGPVVTILARDAAYGSFPLLTVSNADALVAGLALTNGASSNQPAFALDIRAGLVSNVVVTLNNFRSDTPAVRVENGTLTCSVVSNNVRGWVDIFANATVSDSVITRNNDQASSTPVYLRTGSSLMERCRIIGNVSGHNARYSAAVGVRIDAGTLRNCLVSGNVYADSAVGDYRHAGGVHITGGTMENCTIAGNTNHVSNTAGRGVSQTGGTIRNCIIYGNGGSLVASDYTGSGGSIYYSLAPTLITGAPNYNLALDPLFAGAEYQLAVGSPCRDTGTNIAEVTTDLGGDPRPQVGGTRGGPYHDMGAWEMNGTNEAFDVGFYAVPPLNGLDSLTVTFRPNAVGTDTNVTWYGCDFNNDGTFETNGAGMPDVSYTFSPGLYTVVLRATNGLGETAAFTNLNCVSVVGSNLYVATNGAHQFPYASWADAATNIHGAMDAAVGGCTVWISNGVFLTAKQIVLSAGIRLVGNGRDATVLQYGSGNGVLQLSHSNAFVCGLMVKGGSGGIASGIDITAGTASNVIVTACGSPRAVSVANGAIYDSVIANNSFGVNIGATGTLEKCVVSNNVQYASGDFVPIFLGGSGALMNRCRVIGNYGAGGSGRYLYAFGVRLYNGALRNTLVACNINLDTSSNNGPGGVLVEGGTMENCTIVANTNYVSSTGGKGVHQTGGTIRNCIIYGNNGSLVAGDYTGSGGTIQYSLAPTLIPGAPSNNLALDPLFTGAEYQLAVGSPCRDAGTNIAAVTIDLGGNPRPQVGGTRGGPSHDMGAWEMNGTNGAFDVGFFAESPLNGLDSLTVMFRPNAVGVDTNVTWYGWDFNDDGTFETNGAGLPDVSYTFSPGLYTVVLRATNGLGGTAAFTNLNCVSVVGSNLYVATNGAHQFPYASWADAATNIHNAIDVAMDGSTIWISNGVFLTTKQIVLSPGIRIVGSGRDATVLQYGSGTGILKLGHTNAFATALTVKGGSGGLASGIHITGGVASNVAVTGCGTPCAVSIENGLMTASLISNNSYCVNIGSNGTLETSAIVKNPQGASGPATVYLSHGSALMSRCRVVGNYSPGGAGRYLAAVGVRLAGGTLRDTLVAGNHNDDSWSYNTDAGGVLISGGTMENCTIVANTNTPTSNYGKGVQQSGGTVRNCIIYGNGGSTVTGDYVNAGGMIAYSLAPGLAAGVQGNIAGDPLFLDTTNADFRLRKGSPCINAGTNLPGSETALDLDGLPRLRQTYVDMGAYESAYAVGSAVYLR